MSIRISDDIHQLTELLIGVSEVLEVEAEPETGVGLGSTTAGAVGLKSNESS